MRMTLWIASDVKWSRRSKGVCRMYGCAISPSANILLAQSLRRRGHADDPWIERPRAVELQDEGPSAHDAAPRSTRKTAACARAAQRNARGARRRKSAA